MCRSVILIAFVMTVTACGSDEPLSDTTGPSRVETTSTFRETTTTTAPSVTTTSSPSITATTGLDIDVEIAGGEAQGPDSFEVTLGDIVDIWILSDVDDEIHVHGYDLRFDLAAGAPFNLRFEADVPGVFEVETHGLQAPLFEIEVTG
jgi:hypothetical protein